MRAGAAAWIVTILAAPLAARGEEPAPPPPADPLIADLRAGALAAIAGEARRANDHFDRAVLLAPELRRVQEAAGTAALLLGDRARARRILSRTPRMATYAAMAQLDGPGGLTRATTTLSSQVRAAPKDHVAGALFLAALAFARVEQSDRAHELLKRALELAPSPLDESFAPDPAVAMVRSVIAAVEERGGETAELKVELAVALFDAGRRGEAVRIAEQGIGDPKTRAASLRILVLAENAVFARRALERVERLLREDRDAADAQVARGVLLARLGEHARADQALEAVAGIDVPELQSERDRARAEILLAAGKDPGAALELAEAAVRADPKSDAAVGVMIRALISAGKAGRAEAFVGALLKRKPKDVDPFALLAAIHEARQEPKKAAENRLRSRAFSAEKQKLEHEVELREQVLRAVRDAESGLGATGLEALRGEHPALALPIDLALVKSASPGYARAARDRILAACAPALSQLLGQRRGWDRVTVKVSLYGQSESLDAPLSAADPGRCRVARGKKR